LKPTFLIPCCSGYLLAALQVQAVRFTDLRYFFSQLSDALFDGLLHEDRLAEHAYLCGGDQRSLSLTATQTTKKVYALDDQTKPEQFAGQKVKVTGTLDQTTETIHVTSVAPGS
jgi:Protein of unknown function (DUF5818)